MSRIADGDDAALGAELRRFFSTEHCRDILLAMSENARNGFRGAGLEIFHKPAPSTDDYAILLTMLWLEYRRMVGEVEGCYAEIERLAQYEPIEEEGEVT